MHTDFRKLWPILTTLSPKSSEGLASRFCLPHLMVMIGLIYHPYSDHTTILYPSRGPMNATITVRWYQTGTCFPICRTNHFCITKILLFASIEKQLYLNAFYRYAKQQEGNDQACFLPGNFWRAKQNHALFKSIIFSSLGILEEHWTAEWAIWMLMHWQLSNFVETIKTITRKSR